MASRLVGRCHKFSPVDNRFERWRNSFNPVASVVRLSLAAHYDRHDDHDKNYDTIFPLVDRNICDGYYVRRINSVTYIIMTAS